MYQRILTQIRDAAARFGKTGDGSLECVGITVTGGEARELKVYRLYQRDGKTAPIELPGPLQELAARFRALDTGGAVRIADISADPSCTPPRLRLCVKFRSDVTPAVQRAAVEQVETLLSPGAWGPSPEEIDDIIQRTISPNRGAVVQLGTEVDACGTPHVLKSYFALRSNRIPKDYYFRFVPCDEMMPVLEEIWAACGCGHRGLAEFAGYVPSLEALDYHPFLLGVNQSAAGTEFKIYFMLHPYGRHKHHLADHGQAAMAAMGCGDVFPADFAAVMEDTGLFLRGFGFFISPKETGWKLYFAPIE